MAGLTDNREETAVTHPLGPAPRRPHTPFTPEEKIRAEANFVPLVIEHLLAGGRFRISADTAEQTELFQNVASRVGEALQRPVVSYSNGRYIVITFAEGDVADKPLTSRPREVPPA